MPKRKRTMETVVGIFVLASLALLLAMVMLIGRRQSIFEKRYEITGVYDSVAGLQPGAEVHLAGINVGYIKQIKFSKENRVEVVMTISKTQEERIRGDSLASVRVSGGSPGAAPARPARSSGRAGGPTRPDPGPHERESRRAEPEGYPWM